MIFQALHDVCFISKLNLSEFFSNTNRKRIDHAESDADERIKHAMHKTSVNENSKLQSPNSEENWSIISWAVNQNDWFSLNERRNDSYSNRNC
jgi:hypothetical protein